MEYSPAAWESHFKWDKYVDLARMLVYFLHQIYTLFHYVLLQSGSCGHGLLTRSLGNALQVGPLH
jgi:hypothetical protein